MTDDVKTEDSRLCWYTIIPVGAEFKSVRDKLQDLIKDEAGADIEMITSKWRLFVRTRLPWDFLREIMKDCVVAIAENKNREQEALGVQSQTTES